MALFIGRRLMALTVVLALISVAVFVLLYVAPGSLDEILLGDQPASPEAIHAIRQQYHLDQPLPVQYLIWLQSAAHGEFGRSIRTGEPVLQGIARRLQLTLFLGTYAFLIAMVLGLLAGILAAVKKGGVLDRLVVSLSVVAISSPAFVSGIFLLYFFGVVIKVFPVFGQGENFPDRVWHLTLPAVALALTGMALVIKLTRAAMIVALEQDFVAFARARGLSPRRVLVNYALRNSLNPVITAGGLIFNRMLFGTVVVEVTFALPGLGSLLIESVNYKDVPMVQGLALLIAGIVVVINLVVDILYLAIDPRVRLGRVAA